MKEGIKKVEVGTYRFSSDKEPTIEQLNQIMKEVAIDVRQKSLNTNIQFQEELKQLCIDRRKQYVK